MSKTRQQIQPVGEMLRILKTVMYGCTIEFRTQADFDRLRKTIDKILDDAYKAMQQRKESF